MEPLNTIVNMYSRLADKKGSIAVIGLGYVGLPLALELAKNFKVIGFDINKNNISLLNGHTDPSRELGPEAFEGSDIIFTDNPAALDEAVFFIVAVKYSGGQKTKNSAIVHVVAFHENLSGCLMLRIGTVKTFNISKEHKLTV